MMPSECVGLVCSTFRLVVIVCLYEATFPFWSRIPGIMKTAIIEGIHAPFTVGSTLGRDLCYNYMVLAKLTNAIYGNVAPTGVSPPKRL